VSGWPPDSAQVLRDGCVDPEPVLIGFLLVLMLLAAGCAHQESTTPDRFASIHPTRYRCDDGQEILATFIQLDPPTARIERAGARWELLRQPSATGARYTNGDVTFWDHHGEARFEREGRAVTCRAAPTS
jgi:membrane-bound inhibitor of C-type lysozyme